MVEVLSQTSKKPRPGDATGGSIGCTNMEILGNLARGCAHNLWSSQHIFSIGESRISANSRYGWFLLGLLKVQSDCVSLTITWVVTLCPQIGRHFLAMSHRILTGGGKIDL